MLLSYDDRTRIIADEHRPLVFTENGIIRAAILLDGFVSGIWKIGVKRGAAALIIEPFAAITGPDREVLIEEGHRLLAFAADKAKSHEILFSDTKL
ncbi:MAG: hypothetical protein K0Q73_6517 [Paenibacillus sp.]|nr:hypothetical protein [Paenibacillus sp.]